MSPRLHKLNLSQFRNYDTLRLAPKGAGIVVLTGPNGAGKTNILEAISLLAPGKGLRAADLADMQNTHGDAPWAIAAEIETAPGTIMRLGTGLKREDGAARRVVRLNGRDLKSQSELGALVACVWLTPQMDRLFLEGAAARRRFLDRLVFAFAPDHAFHVARADRNMRARLRLLLDERGAGRRADPAWLKELESQMAADFCAIAAARLHMTELLNAHLLPLAPFPLPRLAVTGAVEEKCAAQPALSAEEELRDLLSDGRAADAAAGRTLTGTHRSDLSAVHAAKNRPAEHASTGEQKGMLTAIMLAHARMMKAEKGFTPLILLDEVAAHLDAARQEQLFDILAQTGGQSFLTGTDPATFRPLSAAAAFFSVRDGWAEETGTGSPAAARSLS